MRKTFIPLLISMICFVGSAQILPPEIIPYPYDSTVDRTPTLRWHMVSGATSYRLLIDTTAAFSSPLVTRQIYAGDDTVHTESNNLPLGMIYWKVSSSLDTSLYSEIDSILLFIRPPNLIPYEPDPTTDRTPTLQWELLLGNLGAYRLEVDNDPTFPQPLTANLYSTAGTFTPWEALPIGLVYWRVSSGLDLSLFSDPDTFMIIGDNTPPVLDAWNGDTTMLKMPELSWYWLNEAHQYRILISKSDNFSDLADTSYVSWYGDTVPLLSYTPSNELSGGLYFWKVASDLDWALFSAIDSFFIASVSGPSLVAPDHGAEVKPSDTLVWTRSVGNTDVIQYYVAIARNENVSAGIVADSIISDTALCIADLLPDPPRDVNLYWKVWTAINGQVGWICSSIRRLVVREQVAANPYTVNSELKNMLGIKQGTNATGLQIQFSLREQQYVTIHMANARGQVITLLNNVLMDAGTYSLAVADAMACRNLSNGVYIVSLKASNFCTKIVSVYAR